MLLVGMPWLLVSFASITRNMFAANAVPVFCSRMVQDIKKILTALGAGTEAIYQVHVPKLHSVCCSLFSSQRLFLFLQSSRSLEGPLLKHVMEQPLGSSWRALSYWKLDLMFHGVPHTRFCMATLFSQRSFLALHGVHDPDRSSGTQVWITEMSLGVLQLGGLVQIFWTCMVPNQPSGESGRPYP